MLSIVGTGFRESDLSLGGEKALKSGAKVILHTGRCDAARFLDKAGVAYETLDGLYDACEDFDEHTRRAADYVLSCAEKGDTVYAVFETRDETVREIVRRGADARIFPGSTADDALGAYTDDVGTLSIAASEIDEDTVFSAFRNTIVREIDSAYLAGTVKLALSDVYPDEWPVIVLHGETVSRDTLLRLDRLPAYDHTLSVLLPALKDIKSLERFDAEGLDRLIKRLTAPDGCPWDRVQTHASVRDTLIEEAYEAAEQIDRDDPDLLAEELGDLLFDLALQADIGRRHGEFNIKDVTTSVAQKMLRRHPALFGSEKAGTEDEAQAQWERVKREERGDRSRADAALAVAHTLPAMIRASKMLKRMGQVPDAEAGRKSLADMAQAAAPADAGVVLMEAVRLAMALGRDPEQSLREWCDGFEKELSEGK